MSDTTLGHLMPHNSKSKVYIVKCLYWYLEVLVVKLSLATIAAILISLLFLMPIGSPHVHASGCTNNYGDFAIRAGGDNYFTADISAYCYQPYSETATYFKAVGSAGYIAAQGDSWLTQLPQPGGARYSETGRSAVTAYPTNGLYYYVQETYSSITFAPEWACTWYNLPNYYITEDYNCVDIV